MIISINHFISIKIDLFQNSNSAVFRPVWRKDNCMIEPEAVVYIAMVITWETMASLAVPYHSQCVHTSITSGQFERFQCGLVCNL